MRGKAYRAAVAALLIWGIAMVSWEAGEAQAATLRVGKARGRPAETVTVPIQFAARRGEQIVGLSADIRFDPAVLSNPRCEIAGKLAVSRRRKQGAPDQRGSVWGTAKMAVCSEPVPGVVRIGIFGLNVARIPRGKVATVTFDIAETAPVGRYELAVSPGCAGPGGKELPIRGKNGSVRVVKPEGD